MARDAARDLRRDPDPRAGGGRSGRSRGRANDAQHRAASSRTTSGADTLRYMPNVKRLFVHKGIRFNNGYVVNPLCCPSRASDLDRGLLAHDRRLFQPPRPPFGGFASLQRRSTVATWLQEAGYRTGQFGKYFNGYRDTTYVPPGWDRWFATYDRDAATTGTPPFRTGRSALWIRPVDYGQTVLRSEAVSFIQETDESQPLFMYWATHAPHAPAIARTVRHEGIRLIRTVAPAQLRRGRTSVRQALPLRAVSPSIGQRHAKIDRFRTRPAPIAPVRRSRSEGDRRSADDTDRLENTIIVFISDNGMLWGEHRLDGKSRSTRSRSPFRSSCDTTRWSMSTEGRASRVQHRPRADLRGLGRGRLPEPDGHSLLALLESSGPPDGAMCSWSSTFGRVTT